MQSFLISKVFNVLHTLHIYTICKRYTDKTSRDHSQFACCNQTVTTINKWWTPLSSLVFMGLCVCARILNHNMVKYTLQLCRKEMTVVMEFLVENLKSHRLSLIKFIFVVELLIECSIKKPSVQKEKK